MKTVRVSASKEYDVMIGSGLIKDSGKYISEVISCKTLVIVSDDNVFSLYGETVRDSLNKAGFNTVEFVFPQGEESKNLITYGELLNTMNAGHVSRGDAVVALGGGVAGDLAGFAAATYQRGIGFIQIPTTLLAAVDSSVGGKTGVDLRGGKNQVGAFYQPMLVICDTDTLESLPDQEYRNGCAEIIKYAMLGDRELFGSISDVPVRCQYEDVIYRCVSMKRDFVEKDERDTGCRMMLNFGHTFGHAIETCSDYAIPHGMAVAAGMAMITKAANAFGICDEKSVYELNELLIKYGLPITTEYSAEDMAKTALSDKKRNGDRMTIVVPEKTGSCILKKIGKDAVEEWLKAGGAR